MATQYERERRHLIRVLLGQPEKWLTVKDLAPLCEWSESKTRAVVNAAMNEGELADQRDSRPSYSTDYPMLVSGYHTVRVYSVTRRILWGEIARLGQGA